MEHQEIEIIEFQPEGYKPLVDFGQWRVAVLKFCDDLKLENIKTMQKHLETDEVFVLIRGNCTLFLGKDGDTPEDIHRVHMEPGKIYNIKKGVWHNHIMDEGTEVLIVENRNTCDDNSPIIPLNAQQLAQLNA
ncbi:MAG TPA: hypothetical protein IAB23_01045 [Candidatus Scybalocola faecavium]|nr:hypothetical protein [Candidatus Scybalocola faecavium]